MDCLSCHVNVLQFTELFFYCKGEKEVFLSIKPEVKQIVLAKKKIIEERESAKKIRIKCNTCNTNLGCVIPFGPQGTYFSAFGCDKVKLAGRAFGKKGRWRELYPRFTSIETRDPSTFFNVFNVETTIQKKEMETIDPQINFPSINNLDEFEWISVSLDKQPRSYQIEAFIEALQKNLIVVLKTGSGKTLVASMFLGRMCALNPKKMGLLIVDRVPLVFQQGDAVKQDTNLRVARLCGENRTALKVKQLNDNNFDVLVVTAGAFYEMVMKKELSIDSFCAVVLDECHHVSGGHRYVDVLRLFTKKALTLQPRILGLTASPVNGKTLIQCENRLESFLVNFPNAKIFSPHLPKANMKKEEIVIKRNASQHTFLSAVYPVFMQICKQISRLARVKDITPLQENLLNAYQVVGDLRSLDNEYGEHDPELRRIIPDALMLLDSMEVCNIMGSEYGCQKLENTDFADLCRWCPREVSTRIDKLDCVLYQMGESSKILIFVSTRNTARMLTKRLQEKFPHLNPEKVVGHGGYDGMDWESDQKDKIHRFSTDKCNVLVATSVLEEGLDVASCDVVVCFTGVNSLIKFIQARGRARKEGSKFIIYKSESESNFNLDLQLQEEMLKAALQRKQNTFVLFSEMSKDIKRKIENELMVSGTLDNKRFEVFDDNVDSDYSFLVYCDISDFRDTGLVKSKLAESLEEYQEFTLKRLVLLNDEKKKIEFLPEKIFSGDALVFLVSVKCRQGSNAQESYKDFCKIFPSFLQLETTRKLPIWTKSKFPRTAYDGSGEIRMNGFQLGYFVDKMTIVNGFLHESDFAQAICFKEKDINISIDVGMFEGKISIPKPSIQRFALLSATANEVLLSFCLKYPPTLWVNLTIDPVNENWQRLTISNDVEFVQAFGKYPVLTLKFNGQDFHLLSEILDHMFPVPYYNVRLHEAAPDETTTISEEQLSELSFFQNMLWNLKCLEDSRTMCFTADIPVKIVNLVIGQHDDAGKNLMMKVVEKCCYNNDMAFFYGFDRSLNETYKAFSSIPLARRNFLEPVVPAHHHLIKRAFVTPLRVVLLPPVPVASNRLLRKLATSRFPIIIISFKDEDFSKIQDASVLGRVQQLIAEGVILNGIKYHLLCSTGSQLREHKGYFIGASYEEVLRIRQEIIPNPSDFTTAAKYFARLGIYGTADKKVCSIQMASHCHQIDDLKAANNDLVTDGAGKISMSMASMICDELALKEVPSAFQIRFSGVKGIVVTSHNGDTELGGKFLAIRPSMTKFRNNDTDFCVSSTSRLIPLSLNREIITLLSSIPKDWGLENVLLNYQETALAEFSEMFNESTVAFAELRNFLPKYNVDTLQNSRMEIIDEKFWISVLQGMYRLRTREIRTKTNIPLDPLTQGCLFMGVPDPYGVLEEGEVFVQLKTDKGDTKVKEGPLLIFRNPCLHPGDCPTVTGVNRAELRHLFNVIVHPVKNCRQSLPSTCSGGDLDGDLYAVIWDKNLIPPSEFEHVACNYTDLATPNENQENVDVTDQQNLANYFKQFMSNDCLGRIATKHLSISDQLDQGARDPLAIELSKAQSQAVDYPKTGIIPIVPKLVFKPEYGAFPDFMEKDLKSAYLSKKILGILYRRCRSLAYDFDMGLTGHANILMNMNLLVQGHEEFLESAAGTYVSYAFDMEMVMRRFELKVEVDVFLGQATYTWSQHLQADKGKASKSIAACYEEIVKKYRNIFYSDVSGEDEKHMKASAWYRVANDPEIKVKGRRKNAMVFLSFPWIMSDILCNIREEIERPQFSRRLVNIGESALELFKNNSQQLLMMITQKLKKARLVENVIERFAKKYHTITGGFLVEAYGSTSMFICEAESDIDVCVLIQDERKVYNSRTLMVDAVAFRQLEPSAQQKHFLQQIVSRAIDSVVSAKREVFEIKVPIIKCSFQDGEAEIQCDISMNEVGYRKTLYMRYLYETSPRYLPLFWILVRWARLAGIIRSTITSDKIMDSAEFYVMIIHVLGLSRMEKVKIGKPSRWSNIKYIYQQLNKFKLEDYFELGKMLFDFFRKATLLKGNMEMEWPAPNIPNVCLDSSQVEHVSSLAAKAHHALSATRDINVLLNYFILTNKDKNEIKKTLPLNVSYAIGKAKSFHAARLSEISGATVTLDVKEGRNNLELRAEGSRLAIENLQNELKSLISNNKALVLGRLPQKSSRYFMEGSSIFIARNATDSTATLEFENSFGAFELHHNSHQRSATHVRDGTEHVDWVESARDRLREHVFRQFQRFPHACGDERSKEMLASLDVTVRFGCFYLVDIESHLPDAQRSVQLEELQLSVEKGRRSRKSWMRGEFRAKNEDENQQQPRQPNFVMIPMPKGKVKKTFDKEKVMSARYKNKKAKRGIAAAFTPGLLKNNTPDESTRQTLLECYHQVMNECGFRRGQITSRSAPPLWRVSVNPSSSYEVQVNFDGDLRVLKVAERALNWIHGTILDGRKQHFVKNIRTNPDIRILVSTEESVKPTSDLYRSVFPENRLPFKLEHGKPKLPEIPGQRKRKRDFVSMVRNVKSTELFTNGRVDACIVFGEIYFGNKLTVTRPFCEMSLYFDKQPLIECITNGLNSETFDNYIQTIFNTSLQIKESLDKVLTKLED